MARIKSKDTGPEKAMSKLLRAMKLRYWRHVRELPGKPDFVLKDRRLVINVDGEFWHGRRFDAWKKKLKPYWLQKVTRNILRDRRTGRALRKLGWTVIRFWEPDILKRPAWCAIRIENKFLNAEISDVTEVNRTKEP